QQRLGKKFGISRTSINKIETGKTIPSLKTANDIANALGICMYQVFDLDDSGKYMCPSCKGS
ncbi:MAG: helix-turn-helix domain-containing protein, partial [Finegoldia magna]|uniref:helix-turn-helix transcriptional regulator n=1 Tax=Finegoldia magna TaxID=1260 RepID=UPI00291016F6